MRYFPKWVLPMLLFLAACKPATTEQENMQTTQQAFLVGAASATINPPLGSFIAGDKQNRKFTGLHDDLYAKAVVFYDGKKALALVTLDCIGLLYPEVQRIQKLASSLVTGVELSPENIVVASTHTHSGPDVVGIWGPDPTTSGVDTAYLSTLVATAAQQVKRASEKLVPATGFWGLGEFGEGWVQNISEPQEIDRSLTSLYFATDEGIPVVTLTNFACHPTYLDAHNSTISADFIGGFYQEMAKKFEGEHLFLQGAIGGWVQPEDEASSIEQAFMRGGQMADAVAVLMKNAKPLEGNRVMCTSKKMQIPLANVGFRQLAEIGVINRELKDTVTTEVVWFGVGHAQFITHPGETPPAYSFSAKALMTTEPKFVVGLGMDAMGYILKPSFFEDTENIPHATYLTSMSPGPATGPLLEQVVGELLLQH